MRQWLALFLACLACGFSSAHAGTDESRLRGKALDQRVEQLMRAAHVPGLALALVEHGQVTYLHAYGERDTANHQPLTVDTVMYAASITKAAFSYAVMTLVDEHRLALDKPITNLLPKPLPDYAKYADLAGDERWRSITLRMLLAHTAGFPNFRFFTSAGYDPKGKLTIAFDPGARFAYSGEGINLLQFALEEGTRVDVGELMQRQLFDRFGMTRTGMTWRDAFADNLAVNYDEAGKPLEHKHRESVRAAGSMDTTPHDYAQLLAGMVRGDGLSAGAHADWLRPVIRIHSAQQFPTLDTATTSDNDDIALSYASGVAVYRSPQGPAWFKTGHDDGTNNLVLCLQASQDCVMIMSNSSHAEGIYRYLLDITLGATCYPWFWDNDIPYDHPEWSSSEARGMPHPPCADLPFPR
ncbi:MAG TPA: serine hydrolase domain-containing protein [Dyella sp.]|uniref:serine hydrolase domain-containing protein n=1 Tax=Dyella sp. TaxID=1869338 RepID=UPI002D797D47|nr:serine hydrolase domain-containing protein [Dyella sp.]HET6555544.1 serine hydrolase domain-containing protein [Dyella sp.]